MASYLGIDASLEGTGLCQVAKDGAVLRMETVSPRGLRGMDRLELIESRVADFLSPLTDPTCRVAIEGYAYNAVNQAFSLGEIGGVLRLLVHKRRLTYTDVPPASLKKFATGSSAADKDAMIAAALAAGACPVDDNQADAYHLARIALALVEGCPRERAKLEVVRSLTNPPRRRTRPRPRRLVANPV